MLPATRWPVPPLRWMLRWALVGLGSTALAWQAWNSRLDLNLFGLLQVGGVGLLACLALRRWSPLVVMATLLSPIAWHFTIALPSAEAVVTQLPSGAVLRIDAVVRERWDLKNAEPRAVRLLLSEAKLRADETKLELTEFEVEFAAPSVWTFHSGRSLRLAGRLQAVQHADSRLRLALSSADHAFIDRPVWAAGEAFRIRLQDRANYYLTKPAAAVFLPMVLDVRDRRSVESREVAAEFRRVGVSHLFAISGMNVALIFAMLMVASRLVLGRVQPGQGWVHARDAARLGSVALIWLYIAVIGLPTPAVRAAIMGTALIWLDSRGARTPPLYVLLLTGLAMLAWSPGQFYDISFQLSFAAYAFLVLALQVCGGAGELEGAPPVRHWFQRGLWFCSVNLTTTGIVTLGLWPVIAARFGTFSLLVFAGNLLLVPVMGAVILPSAMLALVVAAFHLGSPPESWLEHAVFGGVELALNAWLWALRWIDRVGGGWVFRVVADWSAWEVIFYYLTLLALLTMVIWLRSEASRQRPLRHVPPEQVH